MGMFTKRNYLLRQMGITYAEYLQTEHWQDVKRRYRASKLSQKCYVCGSKDFELHHKTYKRLGCEWLNDFAPLCRRCHEGTHKLAFERNLNSLWKAARMYKKYAFRNLPEFEEKVKERKEQNKKLRKERAALNRKWRQEKRARLKAEGIKKKNTQ